VAAKTAGGKIPRGRFYPAQFTENAASIAR